MRWMNDLRLALRQLRLRPLPSLAVLVVLSLGIAANSAMFAGFDAWVLRPFDFPRPHELVSLTEVQPQLGRRTNVAPATLGDWLERQSVFTEVGGVVRAQMNNSDDRDPVRVHGARVSAGLFRALGKSPILGRPILDEEDLKGAPDAVVLLSHELWTERYGAAADVLGRTIRVDGRLHEVIGVMERGFHFPEWAELWTPLGLDLAEGSRTARFVDTYARLAPGISVDAAQASLVAIAADLATEHPENRGWSAEVEPLREAFVPAVIELALTASMAAGLCVLLVVCANVASLVLAKATDNAREIAVRTALGAGRLDLLRRGVFEIGVLALLAGVLGSILGWVAIQAMLGWVPVEPPYLFAMRWSTSATIFTLTVTVLAAVLCAAAPLVRWSSDRHFESLRSGRGSVGSGARLRSTLVVGELALTTALLVGALLMVKSFLAMQGEHPGYRVADTLTTEMSLVDSDLAAREDRQLLVERALVRLADLPAVASATAVSSLPTSLSHPIVELFVDGAEEVETQQGQVATAHGVLGPYFEGLDQPIVEGRDFSALEMREGRPVAVVSERLARDLWNRPPYVGRRVKIGEGRPWLSVVGVAGDVEYPRDMVSFGELPETQIYVPLSRLLMQDVAFVVRLDEGAGDLGAAADSMRAVLREVAPRLPVSELLTLEESRFRVQWVSAFFGRQLLVYALLALVIAGVGVYGLAADGVARRSRELAVRLALGATPRRLVRMLLTDGGLLGLLGVGIGLVAAQLMGWFAAALIVGVQAYDPGVLVLVSAALFGVTTLATLVPALRAKGLQPGRMLGSE